MNHRREGVVDMAVEKKRYTISVPLEVEAELNELKRDRYCQTTRNEMFRDLLVRGLGTLQMEEIREKTIRERMPENKNTKR